MTETKSKYRCETCSNNNSELCPFQKWKGTDRQENDMSILMRNNIISAVGCLSHPAITKPLAENNNPVPNSKELILLAQTDWHNREERKHKYEMIPWTMGWMNGFLSERKPYWPKMHEEAIRKDEREKVLNIVNEENNARLKGLEILFETPADKRAELAQDVYLKEAYFELTLVKHFIESLRSPVPVQEHDNK